MKNSMPVSHSAIRIPSFSSTGKTSQPIALLGSAKDFREVAGPNIFERVGGLAEWHRIRLESNLWPYSRTTMTAPAPLCNVADENGNKFWGVNFASQDYLNLSSHPQVKEAAIEAIRSHGVHSAGSAILMGNTHYSRMLEEQIGSFLGYSDVVLFPTGWAAGYGVIRGLIRTDDYVVMDALAHACLQEGAASATKNVKLFSHLNNRHVRRILKNIRANDTANAILVVTESLFSMHSDTPNLRELQGICHEYGATLVVDVAHDLGCLGADGRGHIGIQNMAGQIDIIMGSFSKTFASNGGFVAVNSPNVRQYLKVFAGPALFSNALSPAQAATISKAFEIVASPEGGALREDLMNAVLHVRQKLEENGFRPQGDPSAIIPVPIGDEGTARLLSRCLPEHGIIANLAEYPVVPKGDARLRLQAMAMHTREHGNMLADRLAVALKEVQELSRAA